MNPNSDSHTQDHPQSAAAPRQTFWEKLGGGSLTIAVFLHVILLVIGAFWVFQIIQEPEKTVDFMPPSGGGGERGAEHKIQQKKQAQITPSPNVKRVFADGVTASYAIPEQSDNFDKISTSSSLGGGASSGLGGTGSGGGKGDGKGPGFGSGFAAGMSDGKGMKNPFGMIEPNGKGLEGTLFDAKQSPRRKPNNLSPHEMGELLRDFTSKGWNERSLSNKYFQAEQKLYLTQVYMPLMAAGGAPKAFQCEKEVQPSRWLIIYRGTVIAPKTGKFRFVGASDDSLAVRFNGHNVFDHGFYKATRGLRRSRQEKVVTYKYPNSPHYNNNIGGYEAGTEFNVREGSKYPIEILISEIPGGYFGAALMIQEIGVDYPKTQTGAPLLPLFRTDSSQPVETKGGNIPPYDPNGPVWKSVSGSRKTDI